MFFLTLIVFVFIMGILVMIHEFGHFYFAKKAGILCHEFSIGMGPVIYQKKKGETTFSIRAIPIGGYVSMAGEEVSSELVKKGQKISLNLESGTVSEIILTDKIEGTITGEVVDFELYSKNNEELFITLKVNEDETKRYPVLRNAFYVFGLNKRQQITPYDRSFESKTLLQRFLTIVFGPLMNFILAFFIYLIYFLAAGVPNYASNQVGAISSNQPAETILYKNDQIVEINGHQITTWNKGESSISYVLDTLALEGVEELTIKVNRNNQIVTLPTIKNNIIINSIGISNLQISNSAIKPSGIDGFMVGNIALNYLEKTKQNEVLLSNGDIITHVRIDKLEKQNNKNVFVESAFVKVDTFSEFMLIMKDVDVARVYFRFYDQEKKEIVEQQTPVITYGDELLNNQRIEKITISIGVSPTNHFSVGGIIVLSAQSFYSDFTLIFRTLKILIAPSGYRQVGINNLSGFVGIFGMVEMFLRAGVLQLLLFMALLSVNLGVLNILPIPALDGGRIVFLGYEAVTRKKLNKKVENTINNIMFLLLMLLFVYVTFNDVFKLFK